MRLLPIILLSLLLTSCVIDRVVVLFGDSLMELSTETIISYLRTTHSPTGSQIRVNCDSGQCEPSRPFIVPQAISGSALQQPDWPEYISDTLSELTNEPSHIFMSWGSNDVGLENYEDTTLNFDFIAHLNNMMVEIPNETQVYFLLPHNRIRLINPDLYDYVANQLLTFSLSNSQFNLFCMDEDEQYYSSDQVHFSDEGEERLAAIIKKIVYPDDDDPTISNFACST